MRWTRIIALLTLLVVPVAACDDDDNGGMTGPTDPPGAPAAQAAASGQTVTVSWNPVTGAADYRAVLSTAGETDREQTTSETAVDFTNLTPGTTYFAQVFARNQAGSSQPGTASATTDIVEDPFVEVNNDILTNTTWTRDK
ncbi:MAG: fibronectin type III domain-containing protein, partial [Halobacteriales archaeon]|nr:fibronectin type III domain-containing protein [Halobacteriales archaeon]